MSDEFQAEWRVERKRLGALDVADSIQTVVLGSSHGDCGFDPAFYHGSYNLCTPSQDLRAANLLYRWVVENLSEVRDIILFYAVFSSGFDLCRSSERPHASMLRKVFALDLPAGDDDTSEAADADPGQPPELAEDYRGYLAYPASIYYRDTDGRRAKDHLRFSALEMTDCPEHRHLVALLAGARQNGHNVCLVVPPARADYRAELPALDVLFGPLERIALDFDGPVLNMLDDADFLHEDFGDADHLTGKGPAKLTVRIQAQTRILRS